jgi:L-amino acid N-acyltransferase YncA
MEKRIRSIELSDADAVRTIYGPAVLESATSFETELPDTTAMKQRVRDLRDRYPWLVFEADGRVLGYAYASPHRTRHAYQWCVEVSVYIHADARKSGIGRALYTALFEILRKQGYVNAYAGITLPNAASVGLHEAVGFEPIGVFKRIGFKLGQWHDVVWLELRLSEASTPIANPVPAIDVLKDQDIVAICNHEAQAVKYRSERT